MKQLSKEIATVATIGLLCTSFLLQKTSAAFSQSSSWSGGGYQPIPTPEQREEVVFRYFDGVTRKNRDQIQSCFADEASITDICSLNASKRMVDSDLLADRCMEFLAAHPDCRVCDFVLYFVWVGFHGFHFFQTELMNRNKKKKVSSFGANNFFFLFHHDVPYHIQRSTFTSHQLVHETVTGSLHIGTKQDIGQVILKEYEQQEIQWQ